MPTTLDEGQHLIEVTMRQGKKIHQRGRAMVCFDLEKRNNHPAPFNYRNMFGGFHKGNREGARMQNAV